MTKYFNYLDKKGHLQQRSKNAFSRPSKKYFSFEASKVVAIKKQGYLDSVLDKFNNWGQMCKQSAPRKL